MFKKLLAVSLLSVLALMVPRARAERDSVQFFHDIEVTPDAPVGDAVCFFCSVKAQGKVEGDIVVFFGSVHLNGDASQDVVDFFGDVTAADGSTIGGDVVNFFGSIHLGNNVQVKHDMVAMFGSVRSPSSSEVGGDRVTMPAIVFWGPLLVLFLVIYLIVHEVRTRRARRFAPGYPIPPMPPR